jgi:hypothetical protein
VPSPLKVFAILLAVTYLASPTAFANSGTVHLSTAYHYGSTTYGTTISWISDAYGDSLSYGIGTDSHINFTDFSLNSASDPSWTFGIVSQNGDAELNTVATSFIRFNATTQATKTLNLTFYYNAVPPETTYVYESVNNTIPLSSYYSSYAGWLAAPSPAVYIDSSGSFLMVKSTAVHPIIQFDSSYPPPPSPVPEPNLDFLLLLPFAVLIIALLVVRARRS